MRLYGAFTKAEVQSDGTVRVEGIASSEAIDDQGEKILASAMRAAIPAYMAFPALREMHQLSAAGTTLEAEVDADGMTRIIGHVVDPVAVSKIRNSVYRGFSIGGRVTARDVADRNIITGLQLNEISLVDRPANPEAVFDVWKATTTIEGSNDMPGLATLGDLPAGEKLAAAITPIQIWACDIADHRHLAKADAVECFAKQAADAEAVAVKEPGEDASEVVEPPVDGGAEVREPPTDKGATAPQEGPQAAIAAGLEAIERGKAVLEPPVAAAEETEKPDEIPVVAETAEGDGASKADRGDKPRVVKSLDDVGDVAQVIMFLDDLAEQLSKTADPADPAVAAVGAFVRNLVAEQTSEIMSGIEVCDDTMVQMSAVAETLRKAGLPELAATLDKAVAAKHSAKNQMLLDTAHACATKCMKTDGCSAAKKEGCAKACDAMEAAGAKGWSTSKASDTAPWLDSLAKSGGHQALLDTAHDCLKSMTASAACSGGSEKASKEIMGKVAEAHDHLCAAGANCDGGEKVAAAAAPAPAPVPVDDDALAKALAERDTERSTTAALTKVLADIAPMVVGLTERVEKIAEQNAEMAKQVTAIHNTPIPPMAIARTTTNGLSKSADNGGGGSPALSEEAVQAALVKMSPDERSLAMIKAAQTQPIVVRSVASTAQYRTMTP